MIFYLNNKRKYPIYLSFFSADRQNKISNSIMSDADFSRSFIDDYSQSTRKNFNESSSSSSP
jgi:hypothetical protein